MKKQWDKPELVVLVRDKPEEAVLSGCKSNGLDISVDDYDIGCIEPTPACLSCYDWASS